MFWVVTALASGPTVGSAALSSVTPPREDAPARPQIVNGTTTTAHPNVVALARPNGVGGYAVFCTGTLVHPGFVLTAAHCLVNFPSEAYALFGTEVRSGTIDALRRVTVVTPHPGYDPLNYLNDIGVAELESEVNDIHPAVLNDEPPDSSWLGRPLRFVGFGDTAEDANESGVKRLTDIPISSWDLQYLFASASDTNVCQGDSGGPAFAPTPEGFELAGITAFTIDGCVGGENGATRVDAQLGWLSSVVPTLVFDPSELPPEADTDTDTDTDSDTDTDHDIDRDTGWGEPTLPTKGNYPLGLRCHSAAGASRAVLPWLLTPFLLLGVRRRA